MLFIAILLGLSEGNLPKKMPPRTVIAQVSGDVDYVDVFHSRITIKSRSKLEIIDIPDGTKVNINGKFFTMKEFATVHLDVVPKATITIFKGYINAVDVIVRTKDGRWR